jgi:hypothetical protein
LYLSYQSLVEHLTDELQARPVSLNDTVIESVSYRLVQALVIAQIRAEAPAQLTGHYQFRLCDSVSDHAAAYSELFVSPLHVLEQL